MRSGDERRQQQKEAWSNYFRSRSVAMRLMIWAQRRFLTPKFARAVRPYVSPGDSVLEAGCGTAMNTLYICSQLNAQPWGLDISDESLEQARRFARSVGMTINTQLGDIRNMPFTDGQFSLVWNQGVLEHFEDPVAILAEMARVGKTIFVAVPRKTLLRATIQKAKRLIGLAADDLFVLYTERQLAHIVSEVNGVALRQTGSFNALFVFSWTWACASSERTPKNI